MSDRQTLGTLLIVSGGLLALGMAGLQSVVRFQPTTGFPAGSCQQPQLSQLRWEAGSQGAPLVGQVPGGALLNVTPCQDTILRVSLSGSDTHGQSVDLVGVRSGPDPSVQRWKVGKRTTLNITLPGKQRTTLMYANDYNVTNTRHLLIREIYTRLSLKCPHPTSQQVTSGAAWDNRTHKGLFSARSSMSFRLCDSGETLIKLTGLIAQEHGPEVRITFQDQEVFNGEIQGDRTVTFTHGQPGTLTLDYGGNVAVVTQKRSLTVLDATLETHP